MNKLLILFVLAFAGCQRLPEDVQANIKKLEVRERELRDSISTLGEQHQSLEQEVNRLLENQTVFQALAEGKKIRYILILEFEYSDRGIKQTVETKIEVSREFYESVNTRDSLYHSGNADITVKEKRKVNL